MKKILLILVFLPLVMSAQENSIVVGVNYAPVFSNYQFNNPAIDNYGWLTQYEYKSKYNYSAGLSVEYQKKFLLGGGVAYATKGYVLDYNFVVIDPNDPALPQKATVEAGYLDVLGIVGYPVKISRNVLIIPNLNIIYSMLINNKITTLSGDNKKFIYHEGDGILIKQDLKTNLFSTGVGVAARINLFNRVSLGLGPSLYYAFNKVSDKAIKKNKLFYGVKLGLYFKISKNED